MATPGNIGGKGAAFAFRPSAFLSGSLHFRRRVCVSLISLSLSTSLHSTYEPSFLPTSMFFYQRVCSFRYRVCLLANKPSFLSMNLFFANESVFLLTSLSFCYRVCLSLNKPVLRQQDFHSINEPTHE